MQFYGRIPLLMRNGALVHVKPNQPTFRSWSVGCGLAEAGQLEAVGRGRSLFQVTGGPNFWFPTVEILPGPFNLSTLT